MDLTHLGRASALPASPEEALLDYVPNPRPGTAYLVRFAAPEFTALCPVTGQPDFAHLVIDYAPGATIIESKSLKLFLGAWAAAGLDVTLIGRERTRAEIAENGLTLTDSSGGRIALRPDEIKFATSAKALAGADIVLLCVKSIATEEAAKEIGRNAPKKTAVISFQNGVSNVDLLKQALPKAQVLRGTVPFNVAALGNGRWHKGVAGTLMAEDHDITRALAGRIGNRPGRLKLSDDMVGVAW